MRLIDDVFTHGHRNEFLPFRKCLLLPEAGTWRSLVCGSRSRSGIACSRSFKS
jgi:hypothetical protein